jgi:hypothetical protein
LTFKVEHYTINARNNRASDALDTIDAIDTIETLPWLYQRKKPPKGEETDGARIMR